MNPNLDPSTVRTNMMKTSGDERRDLTRHNARVMLSAGAEASVVLQTLDPEPGWLCRSCAVPVPDGRSVCSARCRAVVAGRANRGNAKSRKPQRRAHRKAITAASACGTEHE
ncbi:MAG: hypothetical protein WD556_09510 [Actinomycetota bacterium]